jgi:hypothetical protein
MKRTIVIALATGGLLVLVAGAASAATHYNTQVQIVGSSDRPATDDIVFGTVESSKAKCVAGRQVKVYKTGASGRTLVDKARAGENGAWAARGDFSGAASAKAVATRKAFGHRGHRKVCKSGSDVFLFA